MIMVIKTFSIIRKNNV